MSQTDTERFNMAAAIKSIALWGVAAFFILMPIVALQTYSDVNTNSTRLHWQGLTALTMVAAIVIGRAIYLFKPARRSSHPGVMTRVGNYLGNPRVQSTLLWLALGVALVFPLAIYFGLGARRSLTWIDSYGIVILMYILLGWGLNIVVGFTGLLDLGYVAFYAVGAYTYAILVREFGLSFWILLPMSGILAAFWGIILGFPVLRLRGDYLAIVTLAFGEIIHSVLVNWRDFSGGNDGIRQIPGPTFFGISMERGAGNFADKFGLPTTGIEVMIQSKIYLYYVVLLLVLVAYLVISKLRRLPVGRAWEALREDEIACRSLGIDTTKTKLAAFAGGAFFGGVAGCVFAARQGSITPESFVYFESIIVLAIVVLGGMGSMIGVVLSAVVMVGGLELLRNLTILKTIFGPDFDASQYRYLIFGCAMVLMMLWKPRGLISTRVPTAFLAERKAISGDLVKEGHG